MSTRNTILDGFVTVLGNIKTANGFNYTISNIKRKFLYYDNVFDFPALLVLGAGEEFEDELGDSTASKMTLRITGYIKDVDTPEESLCNLIQDVLKCIDNDTYNPYKKGMRPLNIETDEGMIHDLASGIAMFILSIEIFYVFKRNNP